MQSQKKPTAAPLKEAVCTQDECVLRDERVDPRWVAKLLVRLASGEDVSGLVPETKRIEPKSRCIGCAIAVMAGRDPLPTRAEVEREIEAGHWSRRRRRRRERLSDV